MAKKKIEETIEDDGLNLKEYIDTFKEALKLQEAYLTQVDWSLEEDWKNRNSHYDQSLDVCKVIISQAEQVLTKSRNNPPKYADEVLTRIINLVENNMKRMKNFSDNKSKEAIDFTSSSFKHDLAFITTIGKDLVDLNKKLVKIKQKEAGVLDIKLKGDQIPSLVGSAVLNDKFPEIAEYIKNRKENYFKNKKK